MAKDKKPDADAYTNDMLVMVNPLKPDMKIKINPKDVELPRATQARVDTDSGYTVEMERAKSFAQKMEAGEVFPPVKLMLVEDMPGSKGKPVHVAWDGHHTVAGAEIAKVKEIDAFVWKGTWAQALAAAATLANVEHENNGKPKSFKDKKHSLHVYVKSLELAGVTKSKLPSNRQLAAMFGISHTAVGDEDPCGRRAEGSKTGEEKKEEKKLQRVAAKGADVVAAGKAHLEGSNGKPAAGMPTYDVLRKATQEKVGTYQAETPAKALETYKEKHPGAQLSDYVTREVKADPKAGSEAPKIGFDWQKMEADLGSVVRGFDAAGELFGFKGRPEFKTGRSNLNAFADILKALRKEATAKKPAAKAATKDETFSLAEGAK